MKTMEEGPGKMEDKTSLGLFLVDSLGRQHIGLLLIAYK